MTKHVVNSREIYHLWAHQPEGQEYARNKSESISYRGVSCYSYSMEIGRIVTNSRGEKAYLCYNGSRSTTTSQHCHAMRRAIPVGETVFASQYLPGHSTEDALRYMIAELPDMKGKADRARSNKAWRLRDLQSHIELINSFATFFDLTHTPITVEGIDDVIKQAKEKYDRELREREEKRKREAQSRIERARLDLPRWLAGSTAIGIWFHLSVLPYAYLRLVPGHPEETETTRGTRVPTSHVRRVIGKVHASMIWCRDRGEAWIPDNTIHLGHYTISRVDKEGVLTVGCHRFEIEEIGRFAALLAQHDEALEIVP